MLPLIAAAGVGIIATSLVRKMFSSDNKSEIEVKVTVLNPDGQNVEVVVDTPLDTINSEVKSKEKIHSETHTMDLAKKDVLNVEKTIKFCSMFAVESGLHKGINPINIVKAGFKAKSFANNA